MIQAARLEAFLRTPAGQFLVGDTWVYFCAHARLFGIVLFGQPSAEDMGALERALVVELGGGTEPHQSLVDASRLEQASSGAFAVLSGYVRRHAAELSTRVTRLALVRPSGVEGAAVAGFYSVLDPPYPVAVFEETSAALSWLGEPTAFADELAAITASATGVDPMVGTLRALMVERLCDLTVEEACRALGISERTLQRRLRSAQTSFQREYQAARLREAQRRMVDSDEPLTAIAVDVGFSSLQHFSALFRKQTGKSPSAWRKHSKR